MRTQTQRLTKLVADMKANEEDLNTNKHNYERIQQELNALGDDLPELSPKKKRQLPKTPADQSTSFMDTEESS